MDRQLEFFEEIKFPISKVVFKGEPIIEIPYVADEYYDNKFIKKIYVFKARLACIPNSEVKLLVKANTGVMAVDSLKINFNIIKNKLLKLLKRKC